MRNPSRRTREAISIDARRTPICVCAWIAGSRTESGWRSGLFVRMRNGQRKFFHSARIAKIETTPRIGFESGSTIEKNSRPAETLGHERIGIVLGPTDHVPSIRKLDAYRRARGDAEALVEHTMFSIQGGVAAGKRLIDRGVTAAVCASDILALGVIRQARRSGLEVPGDLSVVGFDDSALMICTDPPLTTVRQPIEAMGQAAVAQLLSQVGGTHVSSEELLFEPELVVRASTGPAVRASVTVPAR
jgi:LacI family repressor for deo operon, udp, cdd, tsx, nupC, and nupG